MLLMFFYIVPSFTTCEMSAADHLYQFKGSFVMKVACKNFFLQDIKKKLKLELFNKLLLTCKLLTIASF